MLHVAGLLYLGSRVVSAAGNLLAVMIFTRWAGTAEYGHYLLIYSWSLIVYGFGAQWMRYSYFGVFQPQRFEEYVGSLVRLVAGSLLILALVMGVLGAGGYFDAGFLTGVFALVCGVTVYEVAFEVARTRLNAGSAALSMLLRAGLTIAFGSASLWLGGGGRGLALAIAAAHVVAAVPPLVALSDIGLSRGSRAAARHIMAYGWPLLLSFGINAVGQSIDRLLLAHYLGTAALGPYGVVADVLRQTFGVFGQAITLSLVTVARTNIATGNTAAANDALRAAFNACLAVALFGAAFFIVFGDGVLHLILKAEFVAPVEDLMPIFAVSFAFMTMYYFYFAQVIYFTHASYLELIISTLFVSASSGLAFLLVPYDGTRGAAIALMGANIVGCVAFMLIGRRWYPLPIDRAGLGEISLLATLFLLFAQLAPRLFAVPGAALIADVIAFVLLGAVAVRRFGLLREPAPALFGGQIQLR